VTLLKLDHLSLDLRVDRELRRIIHDVTLELDEGEAVGLVGESGAGKSMTSRAVIRLLPPGARIGGDVVFDGRSVLSMDRRSLQALRSRDVAMIFQDPKSHINPVRTIGAFLTEALVERGERKSDAIAVVSELLETVGIHDVPHRLRQYPHELSGGMLQRVMIAAALAIQPRLLLADEPTTALDVTTQAEVMAHLDRQRRGRGLAMVFVTHDLELAAAVCDRITVIYAGSLVEECVASSVHHRVLHPYTAALLASRPSVTRRASRLAAIPGRPQAAHEIGDGCAFVARCPYAVDVCHSARPELRTLGTSRVACHRAEELTSQLRVDQVVEEVGVHV
jgi:oligopeptide/dipeptide ABC transporter ATP-binding protein